MMSRELIAASALLALGCASAGPSAALIEARQMRAKVEQSKAVELAPAHVREADLALAEAERSSDEHDAAIATARYEIAMAEGRRRDAVEREELARRRYFTEQARIRRAIAERNADRERELGEEE
jgi:Mg-chelatase subunit ChlI